MSIYDLKTVRIDDSLREAVLKRLGRTEGLVEVTHEEWDLGFCDTCSYPEHGFAVYVDKKLVWPLYSRPWGGYTFADDKGYVSGGKLSAWGVFFKWLDGSSEEDIEYLLNLEEDIEYEGGYTDG